MKLIELKLHEIHAEARHKGDFKPAEDREKSSGRVDAPEGFAQIKAVSEGSPAANAVSV